MEFTFIKADFSDIQKLKKLWMACFSENSKAIDLFFNANSEYLSMYCSKYNDKIVSALYLVHGSINDKKAHYLCGAATLPEYRRRGIMGKLIEYALNDAKKNGDVYSTLFPANEQLYKFYSRFGYVSACTAKHRVISRKQLENCKSNNTPLVLPINCEQMQKECFKNNFLLQSNNFIRFAAEYYAVYGVKYVYGDGYFALVDECDNCADVFYAAYTDFEALKINLLKSTSAERFVFTGKSDNKFFENIENEKFGMIKSLDDKSEIPKNVYIGITLN